MRLRNFCVQMGFALVMAVILLFLGQYTFAVLYVIGHLIWAIFGDRKTVYGEKFKIALEEKYIAHAIPDTKYVISDKPVVLKDSFVKAALLDTINFTDYSSKKRQDRNLLDQFYSSVMAGEYSFHQHVVTRTELVPGNDFSDDYYAYSNEKCFGIYDYVFKKCNVGDSLVEVTVKGMPISSIGIWLNSENEQHLIAWQNRFYQFKYQLPKR